MFHQLPLEISLKILQHLDYETLVAIRVSSRDNRDLVDHPHVWRHRLIAPGKKHLTKTNLWTLLARREIRKLYLWESHLECTGNGYRLVFTHLRHCLRVIYASCAMLHDIHYAFFSTFEMPLIEEMLLHCGKHSDHCTFKVLSLFPTVKRLSFKQLSHKLLLCFLNADAHEVIENLEQIQFKIDATVSLANDFRSSELCEQFARFSNLKSFTIDSCASAKSIIIDGLCNSKSGLCIERLCVSPLWNMPMTHVYRRHVAHVYRSLRVLAVSIAATRTRALLDGLRFMPHLKSLVLDYTEAAIRYTMEEPVDIQSESLEEICLMPSVSTKSDLHMIHASVKKLWCDFEFLASMADDILQHWPCLEVLVLSGGISVKAKNRAKCLEKLSEAPKLRLICEFYREHTPELSDREDRIAQKLARKLRRFRCRTTRCRLFQVFFSVEPDLAFERILPPYLTREFTCMNNMVVSV